MPDNMRDTSVLKHILEYCSEIERTLSEIETDRKKYDESSIHRNALALCVLQIGELVGILSDEYKEQNTEMPWKDIRQMRNIVAHRYGSFDFDILWETATEDIPNLKSFCEKELVHSKQEDSQN